MNLKSAHTGKVGKAFINARISRSMTQKEVADATLINIEYIKAIESGDYAIFLQGFLHFCILKNMQNSLT